MFYCASAEQEREDLLMAATTSKTSHDFGVWAQRRLSVNSVTRRTQMASKLARLGRIPTVQYL
jgi:hypothetical protein